MNVIKYMKPKLPTLNKSCIPRRIGYRNISTVTVAAHQAPRILIESAPESANLIVQARNPSIDKYLLSTSPPMLNWYFQPPSPPTLQFHETPKTNPDCNRGIHTMIMVKNQERGEAQRQEQGGLLEGQDG